MTSLRKEHQVGDVFEVVNTVVFCNKICIGDIAVMTDNNWFELITGEYAGHGQIDSTYQSVKRIYPPLPEEPAEPVETITLMGKEYDKAEIEQALADVLPMEDK